MPSRTTSRKKPPLRNRNPRQQRHPAQEDNKKRHSSPLSVWIRRHPVLMMLLLVVVVLSAYLLWLRHHSPPPSSTIAAASRKNKGSTSTTTKKEEKDELFFAITPKSLKQIESPKSMPSVPILNKRICAPVLKYSKYFLDVGAPIFIHIPKTGGTTIKSIFGRTSSEHITVEKIKQCYPGKTPALFTILRHPVQRLRSLFVYTYNGGNGSPGDKRLYEWTRQHNFASFLKHISTPSFRDKQINFFRSQSEFIGTDPHNIDYILCTERLDGDWDALRHANSDLPPMVQRKRVQKHYTPDDLSDLSPEIMRILHKTFADDFRLWKFYCNVTAGSEGEAAEKLVVTNGSYTVIKYYIPIANNNKHPSDFYMNALRKDCLGNEADSFKIVGDLDYISSNVPTCRPYLAKNLTFANLKYGAAVSKLSPSCALKFGNPTTPDAFSKMVLIWLNKLNVLCDAENIDENHHIILSDAGVISKWGEKMAHQRTQQMKQCPPGHLCYIPYPKFDSSRTWFGNRKCQVAPVSMGTILSINNIGARHTCNRIINAFEEAIVVVQETQCPCFDEEMVLTYMQKSHPELFFAIGNGPPPRRD